MNIWLVCCLFFFFTEESCFSHNLCAYLHSFSLIYRHGSVLANILMHWSSTKSHKQARYPIPDALLVQGNQKEIGSRKIACVHMEYDISLHKNGTAALHNARRIARIWMPPSLKQGQYEHTASNERQREKQNQADSITAWGRGAI